MVFVDPSVRPNSSIIRSIWHFYLFNISVFFASLINAKNETYVSPIPRFQALGLSTPSVCSGSLSIFMLSLPSFCFLRYYAKWDDEATLILIISWWPSQSWFPKFHCLLISKLFAQSLLSFQASTRPSSEWSLPLAAGKLPGRHWYRNPSDSRKVYKKFGSFRL